MNSDHEIYALIGQASLVYERLSGLYNPQHLDPFQIERRIEAWQQAIASASDVEWQSYLTRNGWGQAQLVTLCSDTVCVAPPESLPQWAHVLVEIWEQVRSNEQLQRAQTYAPNASLHTLAVVAPFVDWVVAHASRAHQPSHIAAWLFPRFVRLADSTVSTWATQRALRGPIPARAHALTPLINDDIWRQFASQHAWLMRVLAHVAYDLCQTVDAAVAGISQHWLALRQHCGMQGAAPQISGYADAPAVYHRAGGMVVECGTQRLVYVPHLYPQCDVLAYITTWLNRRGAQIPLQFPARFIQDHAQWIALPEADTPTRQSMPAIARALGSLAALCNTCNIAQLTPDAILIHQTHVYILDASLVMPQTCDSLAHNIVAMPGATMPAVWPSSMVHTHEPRELWLDTYIDDVLAGYQHTSDAILQRTRDLMHALYSRPLYQRQVVQLNQHAQHTIPRLYDYANVHNGLDASFVMAQILSGVAPQLGSVTIEQQIVDSLCHLNTPCHSEPSDFTVIIAQLGSMTRYTQLTHAAQLHAALTTCSDDWMGRAPWLTKQVPVLTSEQLAGEALQLGAHIVADQIAMPTGCTWFVMPHDNHRAGIQYADAGLVDGVSGIALVLSALSALSQDKIIIETAARGFYHALSLLPAQPQHIGGVGYALALALPALQLPHLCDLYWQHVKSVNLPHMYAHPSADAVHGVASTVLAFIALHRIEPQRGWQILALAAGERLLQLRQRTPDNERIWGGQQLSLGGFGSSGIALALTRLYELTQDFRFLRAVYEIVQHQDRYYDEQHGGWADIQSQPATYPLTWCHGTLGPAMVRLALQSHERTGQPSTQLLALLDGIDHTGMHEGDGLCCGMAGSIDMLLSVSREFHQPYYAERALYWMTQMIRRAHDRGGYVTAMNFPGLYQQPALMQGSAGIAYQIARCAYPRLFPSLLWYGLPRGDTSAHTHQGNTP